MDVKVDQCEQRGHRGPSYPILVWDFGKTFKVTCARHSSHPTYPTHIGINIFRVCERIELNMVEEKVVTLGFSRETLKHYPTSSTQ